MNYGKIIRMILSDLLVKNGQTLCGLYQNYVSQEQVLEERARKHMCKTAFDLFI